MPYSQSDEETHILKYFSGDGVGTRHRFLEVGGYNPKIFSNTRALVELGWHGTYVEPAPVNFASFLTEYRDRPEIVLVNAVLDAAPGLTEFYDSGGDALSSLSTAHITRWQQAGVKFRKYLAVSVTWDDLLNTTGEDYEMLNLDVEGMSTQLFRLLPLKRLPALRLVVIEHDGNHMEIRDRLIEFGFRPFHINGENLIMVR